MESLVSWTLLQANSVVQTLLSLEMSELEQLLSNPDELAIVIDNLLAVAEEI